MINDIIKELNSLANPEKAKILQRFFKTGKGQYGEGDIFLGITSPAQRKIAKKHYSLISLGNIQNLLNSKIHEHRQTALFILCEKYKRAKKNKILKRTIYEFYLKNISRINNWDLVDCSAPHIIGDFALKEGENILRFLVKSENMWERRIAMVSTYSFIRKRNFGEALFIADALINDDSELVQKAVGWMLREIGKRNLSSLELFLSTRYKKMPRIMLRYAIEKFPEEKRRRYLKGEI